MQITDVKKEDALFWQRYSALDYKDAAEWACSKELKELAQATQELACIGARNARQAMGLPY